MVSSTQKGLPAPQTSPSPSSSPLRTHLMETGPTGRGTRKVKPVTQKRDTDPTLRSHLSPSYQVLPAVSFHIFHNPYHTSQLSLAASLIFQHLKLHPSSTCSTLSSLLSPSKHTHTHKSSPLPSLLFDLISSPVQPPISRSPLSAPALPLPPSLPDQTPFTSTFSRYSFSSLLCPTKSLFPQLLNL